ncbi:lipopolysaccharide biosynthesis protein [Halobacillus litoralis]|uniref:lipopolysaccharide biosynthesis protein n=1 Tax=Halobacillus litoralis TaxID=45668 RepID=UPI0013E8B283|nr:oligosaccharide flippase family protein [Halobacillus litoralis]
MLIAIVTTPIITRILTPEDYGIYSLFLVSTNLFLLLALLGTDQMYFRFYPELKRDNHELLRKVIVINIISFIAITILLLVFREQLSELLFGVRINNLIILLILYIAGRLVIRICLSILRMEEEGVKYSFIQAAIKLFDLIIIILLIFIISSDSYTFYIPVLSLVISNFIVVFISIYYTLKTWKMVLFDRNTKIFISYKELIKYGFPFSLTLLITWLFQYTDRLLLKEMNGMEDVGIYSAAFKIVSILLILHTSFNSYWIPLSYKKFEEKNNDTINFFVQSFNIVSLITFSLGIILILCKSLLKILLGQSFYDSINIFPILVIIPVMLILSEVTMVGINFYKKSYLHIYISITITLINVVGSYLLIQWIGIMGAAISTSLSYLIYFFLRTWAGNYFYKIKINYLSFTSNLLLFILLALLNSFFDPLNHIILIINSILVGTFLVINISRFYEIFSKLRGGIK